MKVVLKVILFLGMILAGLIVLFFLLAFIRTYANQNPHNTNQQAFEKGKAPSPSMNGFFKGSARFFTGPWKGKEFSAKNSTGVNVFRSTKRFPFKTYVGKGLHDKNTTVLKLDYNVPENFFLLRLVLDEIVEVKKGEYLGKAYIRIIPGFPFSVAYFRLTK